jgi:CRISPR/Cas system-associated exonuclease Cas4 (RecB family)
VNLHVTIYEAKASTYGEKKTIKKEHYLDLFYQIYVLTRLGYIVDDAYLVYIDRNYIRTEDKTIDF